MPNERKRVFFGMEVLAQWPKDLPHGRLLDEEHRHITLVFLGNINFSPLSEILNQLPLPPFKIGFAGFFDKSLFLPERRPNVVAWHVDLMEVYTPILNYQKKLAKWLFEKEILHGIDDREWLPHVTLCRKPFYPREWKEIFSSIPVTIKDIHLYESVGNLKYVPIWSHPLKPPIEELDHTADIAFTLRGNNLQQIHQNAQMALGIYFPEILEYRSKKSEFSSLNEIIVDLNDLITRTDVQIGCAYKAVSYHGDIIEEGNTLKWEMIVDV